MIVEVMGRRAGWIALYSGVAGGGDIILIPEIPYTVEAIVAKIEERRASGKRFSIVVIAEGAKPKGGDVVVKRIVADSAEPVRLGGVGFVLGDGLETADRKRNPDGRPRPSPAGRLADGLRPGPRHPARRGGRGPDRARGDSAAWLAVRGGEITSCPLEEVTGGPRLVPLDHPLIAAARGLGTSFGDLKRRHNT